MKNIKFLKQSSLRLSRSTLRRWRREGVLVAKTVEGKVMFDEVCLLRLLGSRYNGESVNVLETTLEDWCCVAVASDILLGASPRQMQSLRAMNLLPSSRVGHRLFYLKRDCEALRRQQHIRYCITQHERFFKDKYYD